MPRVIFKCPYLKGGGATAAHRRFYVKYIATREGVQKIDSSRTLMPETKKQRETVDQILREFRNARDLFEYEDYMANPTRGNASALITAALEHNLHLIAKRENYVSYIAKRPRAERMGEHGLFTADGVPVVLEQIANECAEHPGNVWTPIISLRREDAARLGYDNAENWRSLLSAYAIDLAKHLKINPDNLRWYAAYHDEGHHPHVQVVCWSADPGEGYLTKDGIGGIKAGLAGVIFRQELTEIYRQQTRHRDDLARSAREVMERLVSQMQSGVLRNDNIERLTAHLAHRLQFHSGKKQYGYLKAPLKAVVDEIVDELAKDTRVAEAYRLWCEMRLESLRTYQKDPLHPGPLSRQKEFNHIRNIIVTEAAKIIGREFVIEQEVNQPDTYEMEPHSHYHQYKMGMKLLRGGDVPNNVVEAVRLLTGSAEQGNQYAQYALGKLYLMNEDVPRDRETALRWFALSAAQGNEYAQFFIDNMDRWDNPSTFLMASRLLRQIGRIFQDNTPRPPASESVGILIDRKLLQKLREKKVAQGHAEDDHVQTHTMRY